MANYLAYAVAALVLAYAGAVVYLYLIQDRLVYLPSQPARTVPATPAEVGLEYESVSLTTADGVTLDGWFLPATPERATVALFHGNAGNIGHRLPLLEVLHDLGLALLIVDYRGYGRSTGHPSEEGTETDAEAVWLYLTEVRGIPPERIVLFGRSLGAAVAAKLAVRRRPGALVLESPFTSVPDLAATLYPWLPVHWISRYRYDTAAAAERIQCPVLVIHGAADHVVPIAHGRAVFQRITAPKRFLELNGGHNGGYLDQPQVYIEGWEAFLAEFVQPAPAKPE